MSKKDTPTSLQESLVAFCDLANFTRYANTISLEELAVFLSDYFEFVGEIIEDSGGALIKTYGDEWLAAWPAGRADDGVQALLTIRKQGEKWLADKGSSCSQRVSAHYGEVVSCQLGSRSDKRPDLLGDALNIAARMLRATPHGFSISAQAFRKLKPATRKSFKKHTPPISYIPMDVSH